MPTAMTVRVALAFVALSAPALAQNGDHDTPVYHYTSSVSTLSVYTDTTHSRVTVLIASGDFGHRAQFPAPKVLTWLNSGMKDSLSDGPTDDAVSLAVIHDTPCSVRLSQTVGAGYGMAIPCGEIVRFRDAMLTAAGQAPVYFDFQVEKQVATMAGSPTPAYPEAERHAKVEGTVLAQFVVDTNGRPVMRTFKVLKGTDQEFVDAVRRALPHMRFYPAEIDGHRVNQLVQEPFTFGIQR